VITSTLGCATSPASTDRHAPDGAVEQPKSPIPQARGREADLSEAGAEPSDITELMGELEGELGKYSEDFGVESNGETPAGTNPQSCEDICEGKAKICDLADRICIASAGDEPCPKATQSCQNSTLRCDQCK